ncbi:DNA-3-methyladenine glycosylase [candidate division WWE3 bacterium RBG_19FT_COMBO_34_6]|uniref:DNA-3-methyladenine glycosylase n=1 Tax=candidate division WWE3 bacterium RBG_19FT_COMBO_34_6 TaxID=1802612 RepID=A0A1F4UKT1_UNCKA|nr:MAG: DNA-3-methyladenine glycosylase [candidate division WWE3 bacterium RBG_19FT_COMBO_34_6]
MKNKSKLQRCPWVPLNDDLYIKYHDEEWGRPVFDDRKIFEFLTLEIFQAGLSWKTVLYKRENFRIALDDFDFNKIAKYEEDKINNLMNNKGIIRNKLKISATINNAKRFLEVKKEFKTFSKYMWNWVNNKPVIHKIKKISDYVTYDKTAIKWSKDLKKRGFKFLGPTVLYAHMQAIGMINDHSMDCFCK